MDDKWIDKFGDVIEKMLLDNEITMVIKLPEGSMTPWMTSTFGELEEGGKEVMELYILLHALKETIKELIKKQVTDPEKTEEMVEAMLAMVKAEIMEEAADEQHEEL